jgi:putative FmdB family regulatory protein
MVTASGIRRGMLDNELFVPFYEYRRPDGTTFEVMQKMSDPPLTEDPQSGQPVERVFHPIAVHFKGKGFYNTDYGTKKRQREKAAEDSASSSDKKSPVEQKASESPAVKKLNEAKSAAKS